MKIQRIWSMPNPSTFSMTPVGDILRHYLEGCAVIVDPFARNSRIATHRNDLDPETAAESHLPAEVYCQKLIKEGIRADAVIFDPPYSPRQISEVYRRVGLDVQRADTQSGALYRRVRDLLDTLLAPGGVAISCGWNSAGFGKERGYDPLELLVIPHGGAHNDTLLLVERKPVLAPTLFGAS